MSDVLQEKHGTTTKKEFDEFKEWVDYYIDLFGLIDFNFFVEQNDMESCCFATADTDISARTAIITVNNKCKYKSNIREVARHEVLHVVLAGVRNLALNREYTDKQIESMHEAEVVRLTNVIGRIEDGPDN